MEKSIFTPQQRALQQVLRQLRLGAGLRQEDLAEVRVGGATARFHRTSTRVQSDRCEFGRVRRKIRGIPSRMQPDDRFVRQPKEFWANIRTVSQRVGYTVRPKRQSGVKGLTGPIQVPFPSEIRAAYESLNLTTAHLFHDGLKPTDL